MDQTILAVNDNGDFQGEYIPKAVGHTGEGKRHLAITVLLYNDQGQILLQKRKHKIFNDIWDITGATHPLHLEDGSDESLEEASWRCLRVEYGIEEKIPLQNLGFFNYFAQDGENCENEYCAILVGRYNGSLALNPDVGYDCKWVSKADFLKDIDKDPKDYSPWAHEVAKIIRTHNFDTSD